MSRSRLKPVECLRYALSLPTSVVNHRHGVNILDQAIELATNFVPMSDAERQSLLARTANVARVGDFEKFKTSDFFDSTAKHPEWLTATKM